jgi:hypothetical protein
MEFEDLPEKLLELITVMATAALAVPLEEREAWLRRNRQSCYEEAIANKFEAAKANDWADQMDFCVRSMIELIQNSGGAPGGTA